MMAFVCKVMATRQPTRRSSAGFARLCPPIISKVEQTLICDSIEIRDGRSFDTSRLAADCSNPLRHGNHFFFEHMERRMEIIILSNDFELIHALENQEKTNTMAGLQIEGSTRIPGAVESLFEIVALLGVPTVPIAVASGVLANWISSGFKAVSSRTSNVQITFRNGSKEVEIEIKAADMPTLQALVETALRQCE